MPLLRRVSGRSDSATNPATETGLVFPNLHPCARNAVCGTFCLAAALVAAKYPLGMESGDLGTDATGVRASHGNDHAVRAYTRGVLQPDSPDVSPVPVRG